MIAHAVSCLNNWRFKFLNALEKINSFQLPQDLTPIIFNKNEPPSNAPCTRTSCYIASVAGSTEPHCNALSFPTSASYTSFFLSTDKENTAFSIIA